MDAALYFCLREEMQQDAARVERQLDELRRAESFLLRRIHSSRNLASYQAVLNDLSTDISRAESEHAELLHLSRFVTRALVTVYAKEPAASLPGKSASYSPAPVGPARKQREFPVKSNGPLPRVESDATSNPPSVQDPVSKDPAPFPPLKAAIEFDKDGFPIARTPTKSSPAAKAPLAIALTESPPIAEPPTVVFDENGFPLNPPTDDSLNTLVEMPKSQAVGKPIAKKDN